MAQDNKIPVLYLFLYSILRERFHLQTVQTSYIITFLKVRFTKVPKILLFKCLEEMEEYGLVHRINHKAYTILNNNQVKRLNQTCTVPLW